MSHISRILTCIILLYGCAQSLPPVIQKPMPEQKNAGDYQKPIVQYILVPATIRNGIYIPDHHEYVTVKPGGYIVLDSSANSTPAPPQNPENVELQPKAEMISPSSGGDITVVVYKTNMDFSNDHILQKDKELYLFKEPVAYYRLYAKEPVRIGSKVYAFSVNDKLFNIFTLKGDRVTSKSLQLDEAYLTADGYILKFKEGK